VEHDRQLRAREAGYVTHTCVMAPRSATPKNDVIVGWPQAWRLALDDDDDDTGGSKGSGENGGNGSSIGDAGPGLIQNLMTAEVSFVAGPRCLLSARADAAALAGRAGPPTLGGLERFLFAAEPPSFAQPHAQ
jgi:hypothetical protein